MLLYQSLHLSCHSKVSFEFSEHPMKLTQFGNMFQYKIRVKVSFYSIGLIKNVLNLWSQVCFQTDFSALETLWNGYQNYWWKKMILLFATLSSSCMLLSMEAGEIEPCRSTWGWIFEFSSGNFPPGCPPLPLLFRGCATDEAGAGGEDEGVPGDPVNHILVKSLCLPNGKN